MKKWLKDISIALVTSAVVASVFFAVRSCDPDWEEHAAQRELGSDAICDDHGRLVSCIRDGHAYQCLVDYKNQRASCTEVDKL